MIEDAFPTESIDRTEILSWGAIIPAALLGRRAYLPAWFSRVQPSNLMESSSLHVKRRVPRQDRSRLAPEPHIALSSFSLFSRGQILIVFVIVHTTQ